ncbi:hypothetical protein [Lyngbya aestuarii]|uniref:hypothetical protein n=1 Tax=Lyngbya aestuarii TaxID=118322 RepID=UPI00403DF245
MVFADAKFLHGPGMNKLTQVIVKVVVAAAVVGSATACDRFPFQGQNQSANQVEPVPEATETQTETQGESTAPQTTIQPADEQPTSQPFTQAPSGGQNSPTTPIERANQSSAAPRETTTTTQPFDSEPDQSIRALW